MRALWRYVQAKKNRELLGFVFGGLAAVAAGGWAVYTHFADKSDDKAPITISAPKGVAGQSFTNSPITINNASDNAEALKLAQETKILVQQLLARSAAPAAPDAEKRVGEAIGDIDRGAAEGDERLKQALGLLRANKIAEATQLLRAVAEEKTARIRKDTKDAAAAYRNLGAIAGLGDPRKALDAYRKAIELDPDDLESLLWAGWIEQERGELNNATRRFRRVLALTEGDTAGWLRFWATMGVGDVLVAQGNLPEALRSYRDSLAIRDRLAKSDPANAGWQRDLSVSFNKVGDALEAQGNLPEALRSYRDSLAIRDRLAKSDPGNAGWQRDLSVSFNKVGDVLEAQGNLPEALRSYRDSLAISDRLAKSDPGNADWQRDLSVSFDRVGNVLVAQGNLPDALRSYRDSLAIRDRLAKSDPANAGWQRDLSVSHGRIAIVLRRMSASADALSALRQGQAIIARMAKLSPDNAVWKRDLAWFNDQIEQMKP